MRKLQRKDFLALIVPFVFGIIGVVMEVRERGWLTGIIAAVLLTAFVFWYWLYRIRKYPEDTWRVRF